MPATESARGPILVVEDDPGISSQLVVGLRRAGFAVDLCVDGVSAGTQLFARPYQCVVLDLSLPGRDGFDLLRAWRSRSAVPVIVLTARTDLTARLRSFDLGAVDWMSKPFYLQELVARITTRLGDGAAAPDRTIRWAVAGHEAELDLDRRCGRVDGRDVGLTAHEFNLLAFLARRPGRVVTRRQLGDAALPLAGDREAKTINSHIARIRRKLGPTREVIQTVRGAGYCFERARGPR